MTPRTYDNLNVKYEQNRKIIWLEMNPIDRPSFTVPLLEDFTAAYQALPGFHQSVAEEEGEGFRYIVTTSAIPGIFNLGGDLPLFAEHIENANKEGLQRYVDHCIANQYSRYRSVDLPIITISLLQGDALGGGYECALSDDIIIAERSARIGLPEMSFNLFPGMGAFSMLSRRMGMHKAEQFIASGETMRAEELHELGGVDILAQDGEGEQALDEYIREFDKKHSSQRIAQQVKRLVNPIQEDELKTIGRLWVEAALNLSKDDIRKMRMLAIMQDRLLKRIQAKQTSSSYVLANTEDETQRLRDQAALFEKETRSLLAGLDIGKGMHCLDVGFGPGDVSKLMGAYVGEQGQVTGLETNELLGKAVMASLDQQEACSFSFIHGSVEHDNGIRPDSFDLTFARFLVLHLEDPVDGLRRMWKWTKPGGVLMVMDYDFRSMDAYPPLAPVTALRNIIDGVFRDARLDPTLGHKLPGHFEAAGIGAPDGVEVFASMDQTVNIKSLLRATHESFLPRALAAGITTQAEADEFYEQIDHLEVAASHYLMLPLVVAAWKRKGSGHALPENGSVREEIAGGAGVRISR